MPFRGIILDGKENLIDLHTNPVNNPNKLNEYSSTNTIAICGNGIRGKNESFQETHNIA